MPAPLHSLQVQEHKTFHRYTVRARRGTAQGLRDAQTPGSAPRSAGASLRRYNEAALLKVSMHHSTGLVAGTVVLAASEVVPYCSWRGVAGMVGSGKGVGPNRSYCVLVLSLLQSYVCPHSVLRIP